MTLSELPSVPPPVATLRPLPSPVTGLPRLPEPPFRRAVLTTPADRAGARVDCFPAHAAFPKWPEGRHPHCHFRGLLKLHSRYGPSDRSVALRRPLSRGSSPAGCPAEPLVSYRINRQFSGWNLPPLIIRAFGAHGQTATYAVQQMPTTERKRSPSASRMWDFHTSSFSPARHADGEPPMPGICEFTGQYLRLIRMGTELRKLAPIF